MSKLVVAVLMVVFATSLSAFGQDSKANAPAAPDAADKQGKAVPDITTIVPPADPPVDPASRFEVANKTIPKEYVGQVVSWEGTADVPPEFLIRTKGVNKYCVTFAKCKQRPDVTRGTQVVVRGRLRETCTITLQMTKGVVSERRFILWFDEDATVAPKPQDK